MVAVVIVIINELADLFLEINWSEVVFQHDAVLQGLMPALDLALGLRVVWRALDMIHFLLLQPICEIAGDVRRAVVAEQPRLVNHFGTATA